MRNILLAAVAVAAFATPTYAQSTPYVGIEGGLMLPMKTRLDVKFDDGVTETRYKEAFRINHNMGVDVDAVAGLDLGTYRIEGELGWKKTKSGNPRVSDEFLDDTGLERNDFNGFRTTTRILSGMINALLDAPIGGGSTLFYGAGVGYASVKSFGESDSGLAYQGILGLRNRITPNADLGVKYRYFSTTKLGFSDSATLDGTTYSAGLNGRFRSHSLLASLIYNFNAPAPVVAPVVETPPPPPAAPATQTCPDGSVILATDACPAAPPPPPPAPAGERG